MRDFIATLAALAIATAASAASPGAPTGPYQIDKNGNCHDASGQLVEKSQCATMAATAMTPTPQQPTAACAKTHPGKKKNRACTTAP